MSSDPDKAVKVIFTCLDWRLHPAIEEYFTKDGTGCDMCVTAGAIKALIDPATRDFLVEQADISKKLHNCRAAILTIHIDCGAYGGSKGFANMDAEIAACTDQLGQAKKVINENFPGLPVESYIIGLEHAPTGWQILPRQINL